MSKSFEELIAEAGAVDVAGWDFSWLDGRATEERIAADGPFVACSRRFLIEARKPQPGAAAARPE